MTVIQKITNGLKIFEQYNERAIPSCGLSKVILRLQEVEFKDISDEDKKLLNSFGWYSEADSPYLWELRE